jgi:hypothetical protein
MPRAAMSRDSSVVASRWVKVVNGRRVGVVVGGTYTACSEVIDRPRVEVMRSCSSPISSARVGW